MARNGGHSGLLSRVIARYLLFGSTAIICLLLGTIVSAGAALRPLVSNHGGGLLIVITGSFVVLLSGAFVLYRSIRGSALVERQLELQSRLASAQLEPLEGTGESVSSWNRLVSMLAAEPVREQADLDTRLDRAIQTYRENKAEQILACLPDGVAVTDESGTVTYANAALVGFLGGTDLDEEVVGRTMEQSLGLDSADGPGGVLLDPQSTGRPVVVELRRGEEIEQGVLRVSRYPKRSSHGEALLGHVWSLRDITQQKLADQVRDQFVNTATHELRTPLANIKAYAETLAFCEDVDLIQQKSFCNTIDDEVTRLANFVDDLLNLSRMEVGATSLNRQVTDMERLLREAVDKVSPQMKQKQITFDVELPGKLPELVVDKEKLTVSLVNLLGNAAKYTPDGGAVRLQAELKDQDLHIGIEDTGIGIAADELPRVLDKFFRSDDARVHAISGTGLGLSLSNEIIRLHGGSLEIDSELDKGSRFTLVLPLASEVSACSIV